MHELRYDRSHAIEYNRNGTIMTQNDYQQRFKTQKRMGNHSKEIETKNIKNYGETKEMKQEIVEERQVNILDAINRITNHIALSERQEQENRKATAKARENGIKANGTINVEMRTLIDEMTKQKYTVKEAQSSEMVDDFLDRTTFYPEMTSNIKVPYFDADSCYWLDTGKGITATTETITSKYLTTHRLTSKVVFSNQVLRQNKTFINEVNAILVKAIYNKLVESILSDSAETEDQPKGIFNGISASTISTIADLATLQYNGDKNKTKNVWLISPKAKQEIMKLNPSLFNDGKFMDSEYICENRMQDGLIAYLPLDLLVVAQFGVVEITADNVTDAINSNTKVYIDTYFDFDYLDNDKVQLGTFE